MNVKRIAVKYNQKGFVMKKTSKILSFFLTLTMIISAFSVTALAVSGTCGANVSWSLDENGVVTVSGSGDMSDYYYEENPWNAYKDSIKAVVINNGITSIGEFAFYNCSAIESISIPNSVTTIDTRAFDGCSSLKSITIPASVSSIGWGAFGSSQVSLESISVSSGNNVYHSNNSCLIETSTKKLVLGCKNSVIPADGSVTAIGDLSFNYCKDLKTIEIPESVSSIGYNSFGECSSLESINIPEAVTEITRHAFDGCSSLKNIVIHDSLISIGELSFNRCTSLKSIYIGSSVSSISNDSFSSTESLEEIVVSPDNKVYHSSGNCLIETESKLLLKGCGESVIPSDGSVTSIGYMSFGYSQNLTGIYIPDSIVSIEAHAFSTCASLEKVIISDSVKKIANAAFIRCESLNTVVLSDSLTSIGSSAFYDCPSLEKITVPSSVSDIGNYALGYVQGATVVDDVKITGFSIKGAYGSAAETYATKNKFSFSEPSSEIVLPDSESKFFVEENSGFIANVGNKSVALEAMFAFAECGLKVSVYDKNGNSASIDSVLRTGYTVEAKSGEKYTVIVSGDLDGDGVVDSTDYLKIKGSFCKTLVLDEISAKAADVERDGEITTTDFLRIKNHFLGKYDLYN